MNDPIPLPQDDPFAHYGLREQGRGIAVPQGFADRTIARLAAETRRGERRRRFVRIGGGVLAASALLAAGLAIPRFLREPPATSPQQIELTALPPNLGEEWNRAGRSLENLTARATEPASAAFPEIDLGPTALAALEPVAAQPRRAVHTMLRDLGLSSDGN